MRKNPRVPKELPMNGCYSLFSVAMMTAACAGASRHIVSQPAPSSTPSSGSAAKPGSAAMLPVHPESRNLALEDPDERTIRDLRQAQGLFESFIAKAGDDPKYVEAVQRSRERIEDLRVEIAFLEQGIAERQHSGAY